MSEEQGALAPDGMQADTASATSAAPLITTKIQVPCRRTDLLPRQRLVSFFHAHLDRKLILISAPAGYGKTSLLTDFSHDTDLPICWYTLDPFDQDLRTFLEYLIAAIARRFPAFGGRSRAALEQTADPASNLYPIVATLVREIYDAIPEYFVLVLDDHHTVENQDTINRFLDLFVSYMDENCHVILASRTLPALPNLSLLVARRQAAGLSIDELRFTPVEIMGLAEQNYGLKLRLEQAERLAQRTGGWITGLLLTAVPHWERAQTEIPYRGRVGIDLYDYLSKQVLDQQPAPLRDFLLASSVLDELEADLCKAVLGVENEDLMAFLDQVRARNLFIVEFEGGVDRLRYHDLFRDFLQSSLRRLDGVRYRRLTHRAAEVYASMGEWDRAVSRFLLLEEYEPVAEIVDRTASILFDAGRLDTLAAWIDALPEPMLESRPHFWVQRGQIYEERGEHNSALAFYDRAERVFTSTGNRPRAAHVLAAKGSILRFQGRYTEAIDYCHRALDLVRGTAPQEKFAAALTHKNIGLCQIRLGHLARGGEALRESLHLYEELGASYDVGLVHHDLGLSRELAGDLAGAADHYGAALTHWQQLRSLSPWANTLNGLGVVYHLQGRYEEALPVLNEALSRAQQAGDLRVEAYAWASLGDLHRELGGYEHAETAYNQALDVAGRIQLGFIVTYALNGLGTTFRLQGDLAAARVRLSRAMQRAELHDSTYELALCHTSMGVLAGAERDLLAAGHHLDRAVSLFEIGGFQQELGRACVQRAHVSFLAGDPQAAFADLERALDLAGQLGYDQFLVVEGQELLPFLEEAAASGSGADGWPRPELQAQGARLVERIRAHRARLEAQSQSVAGLALEADIQAKEAQSLSLLALGQPRVMAAGRTIEWPLTKSRDLLFLLLQHPEGLRKEQVGASFWPDHSPERLDSAFRSTLYRLRRTLHTGVVIFDRGVYSFDWSQDYWFDVEAFERLLDQSGAAVASALPGNAGTFLEGDLPSALRATRSQGVRPESSAGNALAPGMGAVTESERACLEEALTLYRGDYLEGSEGEWIAVERERLRVRHLDAMERLADLLAEQRDLQPAIDLYRRLVILDPYREDAHRQLMRCHFRRGDRAAAIRQYQTCVEILREELGLSPTRETEELYLRVIS